MPRHPLVELHRLRALHGNRVALQARLLQLPLKHVPAGLRIDLLAIQILHVELKIGHAPRDAIVVPDDHRRHARQRHAGHVQARRAQMHHVPGGGNREIEMRIVRQNRLAGRRCARPKPPTRSIPAAARRRCARETENPPWPRSPFCSMCSLLISSRQLVVSVRYICKPGQHRIAHAPRPRLVIEQRELERQSSAMRLEIKIHAARVRRQHRAIGRRAWSAPLPPRSGPAAAAALPRSDSSAAFPTTSASSPAASRRSASICHIRSCAVA